MAAIFEAFATAVTYDVRSNARTVLGELVRWTDAAADSLSALTPKTEAASRSLSILARSTLKAADAFATLEFAGRSLNRASVLMERGFDRIETAAVSAGSAVDTSMSSIDATIGVTASRVDAASATMAAGLREVNLAAREAAGGITATSVAGNRMGRYASNVSGGSAAGGAAAHAGGITGSQVLGIGAFALLGGGAKSAGDLQNAALQTSIATGQMGPTLDDTMRNMQPSITNAYRMSAMTGGSVNDMMQVTQNAASSGFTQQQLAVLSDPLAKLTDVLHFGKDKMGFGEAATQAAGFAHDLHLFNASDAHAGFEDLYKMGYLSPHGTSQLITQTRRFAPLFERMLPGTTQQKAGQITEYTSWLDRMGTLQFGGSGLNMLATYLNKPKTNKQVAAMEDLGLLDGSGKQFYRDEKTGTYNLPAALEQVARRWTEALNRPGGRARVNDDINSLSANASRILGTLATPDALQALLNLRTQRRRMSGLDQVQEQLMSTLPHAFGRLETNINTLATTLGGPLVAPLAKFVGGLADATSRLTDFLRGNPIALAGAVGGLGLIAVKGVGALLELAGGISFFARTVAHEAKTVTGIRAHLRIPHGGGGSVLEGAADAAAHAGGGVAAAAGDVAAGAVRTGMFSRVGGFFTGFADMVYGGVKGAFTLGGLRGFREAGDLFGRELGVLSRLVGRFGGQALLTRGALTFLAGSVARVGLAAISGVGDIVLLWQGIELLGKHATDIGWVLGQAANWITNTGGPMLLGAFQGAMNNLIRFLTDGTFFKGVLQSQVTDRLQSVVDWRDHVYRQFGMTRNEGNKNSALNPDSKTFNMGSAYNGSALRSGTMSSPHAGPPRQPAHALLYGPPASPHTSSGRHADAGKVTHIAAVYVDATRNDRVEQLVRSIEKAVDRDHVGAQSPTSPHARTQTTPGTYLVGAG